MKLQHIKNVSRISLDTEKCIGCGMCLDVCPHEVFTLTDRKAVLADKDSCMECGACDSNCPTGAIHVETGTG